MSTDNSQLNKALAADLYAKVEHVASQWANGLERGVGEEIQNPFTNQRTVLDLPAEVQALIAAMERAGVADNAELKQAVGAAMKQAAHASMFSVLSAVSGSGAFPSGSQVGLVVDGAPVDSYLHEVYYSARGDG